MEVTNDSENFDVARNQVRPPRGAQPLPSWSVDRVGPLRIIYVFDDVTSRTAAHLVAAIRIVSSESTGRVVVSLLESRNIDRRSLMQAIAELNHLGSRLTFLATLWI